jgi:hypothetical protein
MHQRVCGMEWSALLNGAYPGMRHQTWQNYCFSSVFLSVLLEEGIGLPSDMPTQARSPPDYHQIINMCIHLLTYAFAYLFLRMHRGQCTPTRARLLLTQDANKRTQVLGQINKTDIDWAIGMVLTSISPPTGPPHLHAESDVLRLDGIDFAYPPLRSDPISILISLVGLFALIAIAAMRWHNVSHFWQFRHKSASMLSLPLSEKIKAYSSPKAPTRAALAATYSPATSTSNSSSPDMIDANTPTDSPRVNGYNPAVNRSLQSTRLRNSSQNDLAAALQAARLRNSSQHDLCAPAKLLLTPSSSFRELDD